MQYKKRSLQELERDSIEAFKKKEKLPFVFVLENIRSAHNVGSLFRTADCLGMEEMILVGFTVTPPNRELAKTAIGATDSVAWKHMKTTEEAIDYLQSKGYVIWALEQAFNSVELNEIEVDVDEKVALILGNEVKGVEQKSIDLCSKCVEIKQYGTKHSFNVSVSAGIAAWHIANKLRLWSRNVG